ncbi:MAG: hypothetical protein NTY00_06520 [Deltaproteobacteria bacterium]|nr:hypothetical protein [Deltaproteobacteria bacterium]
MGTRSEIYTLFYGGDVAVKLAVAQNLYSRYDQALVLRPDIMAQLAAVQASERALHVQMGAMAMGATCTQCAGRQGGGCCSRYMAGENDVPQLLMNLLAGIQVRIQQDDRIECCFLGGAGCVLSFKPMFCLNYICSHIKGDGNPATLLLLEQRTGSLLRKQADMEQLLLDFFCGNI